MGDLFQRAIDGAIDFFLAPVQAIYDFLTDPKTFITLTDRLVDAMHTADASFYAYQIPAIFTLLGTALYLVGLAYSVVLYQRGVPFRRAFAPALFGGLLLPLFAYGGPGCHTEGFPCVPKVKYIPEVVPATQFSTYKEARFRFDGGRLVMEEVDTETGIGATPEYRVFHLEPEGQMPPGTALALGLVNTSSALGKRVFYASLARYHEDMGHLREVYQKLTRTAFTLMATSAFTGKLGEVVVDAALGSLIPGAGKTVSKALRKGVKEFFAEKAPPFLRFMLGSTGMTAVRGAQEVAARTARVNMSIAQVLASLPLLLVLSFVSVFYLAVLGAKLAVYALPLAVGLSLFAPQALSRFFNLAVALVVFPVVLGSFFSLSTRVLFIGGIERQIQTFEAKAAKMLESFYVQNPMASLIASQTALITYQQVKNLAACLDAPLPPDWDPNRTGRELSDGGAVGSVACYPAYGVSAYLSSSYQVPKDPAAIRQAALDIARQFSLDIANKMAPDGSWRSGLSRYTLPKGRAGDRFYGSSEFSNRGFYGSLELAKIAPEDPKEYEAFASHTPSSATPLEVGAIARQALAVSANPTPEGLEELLAQIRSFKGTIASLAAKQSLVEDGAATADFVREGIRWEIAWHYAPEFVLEGLREELQKGLNRDASGLSDAISRLPPPILDDALGAYSLLYKLKKGQEGAPQSLLPASDLPLPGGDSSVRVVTFFNGEAIPGAAPSLPKLQNFCSAPSCRALYNEAPYLPYAYLDHYEVLNRVGTEALSALGNMQNRQLMGLLYVALAAVLALYIFRALLQLMLTLTEGLGPSARGVVSQAGQALAYLATYAPRLPVPDLGYPRRGDDSAERGYPSFDLLGAREQEEGKRVRETFAQGLRDLRNLIDEAKGQVGGQGDQALSYAFERAAKRLEALLPLAEALQKMGFTFYLDAHTLQRAEAEARGGEPQKPLREKYVFLEVPYSPSLLLQHDQEVVRAKIRKAVSGEEVRLSELLHSLPLYQVADLGKAKGELARLGYRVEERGQNLLVRNEWGMPVAAVTGKSPSADVKGEKELVGLLLEAERERLAHPLRALLQESRRAQAEYQKKLEEFFRQQGFAYGVLPLEDGRGVGGYWVEREGVRSFILFRSSPVSIEDQLAYAQGQKDRVEKALANYIQGTIPVAMPYDLWKRDTAARLGIQGALVAHEERAERALPLAIPVGFLGKSLPIDGMEIAGVRLDPERAAERAREAPEILRRMVADVALLGRDFSEKEKNFYEEFLARLDERSRELLLGEINSRVAENRRLAEAYASLLAEALRKGDEQAAKDYLEGLTALKESGERLAFFRDFFGGRGGPGGGRDEGKTFPGGTSGIAHAGRKGPSEKGQAGAPLFRGTLDEVYQAALAELEKRGARAFQKKVVAEVAPQLGELKGGGERERE